MSDDLVKRLRDDAMPSGLSMKIAEVVEDHLRYFEASDLVLLGEVIARAGVGELEAMACLSDPVRIKDLEIQLAARTAENADVRRHLDAEIERLRADKEHLIELLEECSEDYNHPAFTDRHGMGPRLRAAIDAARKNDER